MLYHLEVCVWLGLAKPSSAATVYNVHLEEDRRIIRSRKYVNNNNSCWEKKKFWHFSLPYTLKVGEVVPEKPSET